MTREEAIQILEEEAEFLYGDFLYDTDEPYNKTAFKMAIEALTERNIARDIATILENEKDMRVMLQSAERPKGEWIDIDNYYRLATCSRCHKVTMFEKWGEYTKPYNYCPNCGARMKGGAE